MMRSNDDVKSTATRHSCPSCGALTTVFDPPLEMNVRETCGATWRSVSDPTFTVTCYLEPHPTDQSHEGDAVLTHRWHDESRVRN